MFLSGLLFFAGNKISTEACDVADQAWQGCRIDNRACSCAFGCKSEFRYPNMQECLDALKVCEYKFAANA